MKQKQTMRRYARFKPSAPIAASAYVLTHIFDWQPASIQNIFKAMVLKIFLSRQLIPCMSWKRNKQGKQRIIAMFKKALIQISNQINIVVLREKQKCMLKKTTKKYKSPTFTARYIINISGIINKYSIHCNFNTLSFITFANISE